MPPQSTPAELYFVTSADHAALSEDDRIAAAELDWRGIAAIPLVWTDGLDAVAPSSVLVIRSVWDYHLHHRRFLRWLSDAEHRGLTVLNHPALVRWNLDKRYLEDLRRAGVPVTPTRWVTRQSGTSLRDITGAEGWNDIVLKPAVSASAHRTFRFDMGSSAARAASVLDSMLHADIDVLIQPYLHEVAADGEWSLVFFGGEYSHAVLKRPASGDFRVQAEHGGSARGAEPPRSARTAAETRDRGAALFLRTVVRSHRRSLRQRQLRAHGSRVHRPESLPRRVRRRGANSC